MGTEAPGKMWKNLVKSVYFVSICDPTQVNDADVIRGPNCDFDVYVFYRNQVSFWLKNLFDTIFHSKDMRKLN